MSARLISMGALFRGAIGVRTFRILVDLLLVASCCNLWAAEPTPKAAPGWSVQWQPSQLVNGSPVLFRARPAMRLKTLSGKWLDHDISFVLDPKTKSWSAIAGVALNVKPGVYTLLLNGTAPSGKEVTFQRRVSVRAGEYRI